jgi:hypothetical protein
VTLKAIPEVRIGPGIIWDTQLATTPITDLTSDKTGNGIKKTSGLTEGSERVLANGII